MPFRQAVFPKLVNFNSAISCEFLDKYNNYRDEEIREERSSKSSKTFAPSSLHCKRLSWFRLKGTEPDKIETPDKGLDFTAKIGTACHRIIQSNLINIYKDDWIDASWYLENILKPKYKYSVKQSGFETLVMIEKPPIKFACDGILRIKNKYYLLEIKTSDHSSFANLQSPKKHHIDQIICYSTLLGLDNILVMYQDRLYGDIKVFEEHNTQDQKEDLWNMFDEVMKDAETYIAPEKLPYGDPFCSSNMCPYYNKCKEY